MSTFLVFPVFPVLPQILPHDFEMFGYQSSAEWAVPVFVTLCLSVLGCACLYYAVPVCVMLCLSLLRCSCRCSLLGCACFCYNMPVHGTLYLSVLLGCTCLCYTVPNRVLCWPFPVPLLFRKQILTLIPLYRETRAK